MAHSVVVAVYWHSRSAGMACLNHWIPAFAGMTAGVEIRNSLGMATGLSGWLQTRCDPRCHSSEGSPAWMHAYRDVGGRAASGTSRRGGRAVSGTKAEESKKAGLGGEGMAGFSGWRVELPLLYIVIPAVREWLV